MSDIPDRAAHFQKGVDAYQRGEHYEAHEFWEDLWQDEGDDERHRFFQGLIQVASAVHKARNDVGPRGCSRLLDRALERFEGLADDYFGIDLPTLREGMANLRAEVERQMAANDGHSRVDDEHVPPLRQTAPPTAWIHRAAGPVVPEAARSAWFAKGLEAYANGEHFDAHEFWEELWRDYPRGDDRQFLQGLIQVAAAMHKAVAQNKPAPAARLLGRALMRLEGAPPRHWGIDVERLVREAKQSKTELARAAQREQLASSPPPEGVERPAPPPAASEPIVPAILRLRIL